MAYGTIKVDQVTFTNGGVDQTITVSGIVESISGNITATGTIQADTIIGTTTVSGATVTGDVGQFTTATITSGVFASGTAAAPTVRFTGDTNTGIYSPGANQVAISTNGTGRLFVDASGNVRINTSSAAANRLTVNEAVVGVSTPIRVQNASAGGNGRGVGLEFYGISNTFGRLEGFWSGTEEQVRLFSTGGTTFSTAGLERLRITSAGLVGIGTSAPNTLLHLSSATGSASPTPTELRIATTNTASDWSTTDPWGRISFYSADTSSAGPKIEAAIDVVATAATGGISRLDFKTATVTTGTLSSRMVIDDQGRVGIGTQSPSDLLHVYGGRLNVQAATDSTATDTPLIKAQAGPNGGALFQIRASDAADDNSNWELKTNANEELLFTIGASEAARLDASGRLLVGTSSSRVVGAPGNEAKLQIESTSGAIGLSHVRNSDDAIGGIISLGHSRGTAIGSNTLVNNGDTLGEIRFVGADGSDLVTSGANIKAEVDGTPGANDMPGRLVFSTTADGASSPTERMRIDNAGRVYIAAQSSPNNAFLNLACGSAFASLSSNVSGGTTSTRTHFVFSNSNGIVGSVTTDGSATAYNTSSDYRLKENVTPVTDGITRLQQLKPSRFNFIADPTKTVDGFLAHEVQAIVPEAITGEKDAVDEEGNPQYQGIDQSKLVPLLTAALQEAIGEIESLKARVAALESA